MREIILFPADFNMLHAGFYTGPLIFILRYLSLEISSLFNQNIHSNIKQETEDCVTENYYLFMRSKISVYYIDLTRKEDNSILKFLMF